MAAKAKPKLKSKVSAAANEAKAASGKSIMESAQQIWLAGLGAFSKAQGQGTGLFDGLIKEGLNLEAKTRKIATGKVDEVRGAVESGVSQVRERTQETWDRLEQVFEQRVSRALGKLGVPGRKELDELLKRVDELNREVRKINPAAKKVGAGLSDALSATVRRARDDFGDLVKDIEEAQLAAKKSMQRTVAKVADTVMSKAAPAVPAAKKAPAPSGKKPAPRKAAKKIVKATNRK
jgi:poly(hydroxyalkanoate) granule-associated protein